MADRRRRQHYWCRIPWWPRIYSEEAPFCNLQWYKSRHDSAKLEGTEWQMARTARTYCEKRRSTALCFRNFRSRLIQTLSAGAEADRPSSPNLHTTNSLSGSGSWLTKLCKSAHIQNTNLLNTLSFPIVSIIFVWRGGKTIYSSFAWPAGKWAQLLTSRPFLCVKWNILFAREINPNS